MENAAIYDLADDLGEIITAEQIVPGVFYAVAAEEDTALRCEYYVVESSCAVLSKDAKAYGHRLEHHPDYLRYRLDTPEEGRMVVEYELDQYLARHGLPPLDGTSLPELSSFGREYNPEYFGDYPAPLATPKGRNLRYITLTSGVFVIETERLERVLAVCYPIWSCDLSDYCRLQAEPCAFDMSRAAGSDEEYLFFSEHSACLALFEIQQTCPQIEASGRINGKAMMNAIWKYHPAYAAGYNIREQKGLNDGLGLLFRSFGYDGALKGEAESLISLSENEGTGYYLI